MISGRIENNGAAQIQLILDKKYGIDPFGFETKNSKGFVLT